MTREFYERLMRHEAPNPKGIRRKAKYPLKTTAPRCDFCNRWLHPDIDHSECGKGDN